MAKPSSKVGSNPLTQVIVGRNPRANPSCSAENFIGALGAIQIIQDIHLVDPIMDREIVPQNPSYDALTSFSMDPS